MSFLSRLFGDPNARLLKSLQPVVDDIAAREPSLQALSVPELRERSLALRRRVQEGEGLDAALPEAFAICREASRRVLGQRHYDVQLLGATVLHRGQIAEMRTGEGKTLTATLAVYLNALTGKGVHVVTVNDYLARRDMAWMGQLYDALGLTVGCINHEKSYMYDASFTVPPETKELGEAELAAAAAKEQGGAADEARDTTGSFKVEMDFLRPVSRREAYAADITYGTNNEFGFDFLRDNMAMRPEQRVQRALHYAIVDEVDSILIDEARTPLIISAPAEEAAEDYYRFAAVVRQLAEKEHYAVDEKMRAASLTEAGIAALEKILGVDNLYEAGATSTVHHVEQALRAQALYLRDRDYVVKDGEVVIVDEFTGRLMSGRRYSEGLHQAIEAKENVAIQRESQTLATVTFQNYFRLYGKLAGMTGTAATEAEEFSKIYNLDVTTIPPNKESSRRDLPDRVYKTQLAKFQAVAAEIRARHEKGQPVLVGTISIERNEVLGELLRREGVPHELLNAKNHEREAQIIAQAGRLGAVTVATNMAGRGVDILLGGNPPDSEEARKVRELGGLCVIGTERHESRRIDNQLRGRSGRQGDPGETLFFLSLEDDLMRIFGSDRMKAMMDRLGLPDDTPIEHGIVSKSIASAQRKVEAHHFDGRKHLLEYNDVLNKHRDAIYRKRTDILEMPSADSEGCRRRVLDMVEAELEQMVLFHTSGEGEWSADDFVGAVSAMLPLPAEAKEKLSALMKREAAKDDLAQTRTEILGYLLPVAAGAYEQTEKRLNEALSGQATAVDVLRGMMLRTIDSLWVEHLDAVHRLRQGIGLMGYGQRDPLVEYKREAFGMFNELVAAIGRQIAGSVFKIHIQRQAVPAPEVSLLDREGVAVTAPAKEGDSAGKSEVTTEKAVPEGAAHSHEKKEIGRNDPCHCGSGKKFKKCHG